MRNRWGAHQGVLHCCIMQTMIPAMSPVTMGTMITSRAPTRDAPTQWFAVTPIVAHGVGAPHGDSDRGDVSCFTHSYINSMTDYDIIVIGAGIGGLTAAALLA